MTQSANNIELCGGGDPWLLPDHFGQAIHEVIADLAAVGAHRRRSQIVPVVSRALQRRSTASPALRRRLTALATIYAELFAPPQIVRLLGTEVEFFGARFDVVWTTGDHQWADEIKSVGDRLTRQLAQQCQHQLQAGRAQWEQRSWACALCGCRPRAVNY
jgi:hypothetical protein